MGHFLGDLIICPQDDGVNWKVCTPFDYDIGDVGGEKIEVPEGFMTDLGSVPQMFWNIIPPIGKPLRGYVLHDWLYFSQIYTRAKSDGVLLEAMGVAGVNWLKRWTIYLGVRSGGWIAWNQHKRENANKKEPQMTESNQPTTDAQAATPTKGNYLFAIAAKKISIMAGKGAVALASSALATHLAYQYGFNITLPTLQASVAGATLLVLEWAHDLIKVKTGITWL